MKKKMSVVVEALGGDRGISTRILRRLERVSSEFASEDAFFSATRGELMRTWTKIAPESPRGLGQAFFDAFAKARALWTSDEVAEAAKAPADPLGRPATQDLLLWMASFLEANGVREMPFGRLLDIWDQVQEARK